MPLTASLRLAMARALLALVLLGVGLTPAHAQSGDGTLAGRVVDPGGSGLSGVVVVVKSQAGAEGGQAMTAVDGTYSVPALPPGEYAVTFDLAGFRQQRHAARVAAGRTTTLNVALPLAAIPATVTVTADPRRDDPEQTIPEGIIYTATSIDVLAPHLSHGARITMAPGVSANGPNGGITISGGLSYGNLFLLDGLVINENLRGQARAFLIQDAMQETRIATGGVSAEYGRFQGGVVNTITKSGTNVFSGSWRAGFSNDRWRALTPFRGDATLNRRVPSVQVTLGGPVRTNRLWFFAAGELEQLEQSRTLAYTRANYILGQKERRLQGKLTWAAGGRQMVRASFYRIGSRRTNASDGVVMDRASFYDSTSPETLVGVTYSASVGPRLRLEAQYSNRQLTFDGVGAGVTTLAGGTPIWDRSRSDARFNSPTGCAVCGGSSDERDNQNVLAKISYAFARAGTHDVTAGIDAFQETRRTNSYQSGSDFRVRATRANITGDQIYPVFLPDKTTWISWMPILRGAQGNNVRTYSGFAADTWRPNAHLTIRGGVRYDHDDDRDSLGVPVVHNDEFSPRGSVMWDVHKNGRLLLNAGGARYVGSVTTNIADSASSGGRPATYVYDYLGPAINADPQAPQMTSAQALTLLFTWFNANGGTTRSPRSAPTIPGLTTRIDPRLEPPDAREGALGVTWAVGNAGWLRADLIYRRFGNFYARRRDLSTGRIADSSGRNYDLLIVTNTNQVTRAYKAINLQLSTRFARRGRVSAAYTLSEARGSYDGETTNIGPDTAAYTDYPEYREPAWSSPDGWLAADQRHKLRVTGTWDLALPPSIGRITLALVQRLDSGRPWSAVGNINPSAYVANPGYVTPPASVPYYFSARGAYRTDTITDSDVSVNWNRRLPHTKRAQVYARALLMNAFNEGGLVNVGRTVLTRNDSAAYQLFNPFTDTPVPGVNYGVGADFGKPRTPADYQAPREFTFSIGLRF